MSTADQTAEGLMHSFVDSHTANIKTLLTILEQMLNRANFTNEDMRGLAVILKHLKSGGNVNLSTVDLKDMEGVTELLKGLQVPYAVMRDGDTDKCIIITRDTLRDRELAREAFKRFAVGQGANLQQISIDELLAANENRQVKHADGLSASALEVFKQRMSQYSGQYAVVKNSRDDELFDIYYPQNAAKDVENALKDMCYDFTGQEGRQYEKAVNEYLLKRKVFTEKLIPSENGVIYVCSKSDPTRFMTISEDGYAIHRAKCVKITGKDGEERLSMTDRNPIRHSSLDRREMAEDIEKYIPDAVLLTQEEMSIVSTISTNGACIFVPDSSFPSEFDRFSRTLAEKRSDMPVSPVKKDFSDKPVLTSYLKIDREDLDKVMEALKAEGLEKQVAVSDDTLSFSIAFPEDNGKVQEVVDRALFGKLTGAARLNAKLYSEGRSADDLIDGKGNIKEGYIIFDADVPKASVMLSKEGATIAGIENGESGILLSSKQNAVLNRENPAFNDAVTELINGMRNPVVMAKDEYDLFQTDKERFDQILNSRIPTRFDTPAEKEYYRHAEQRERAIRDELHKHDNAVDIEGLPEKSKQAIRDYKDLTIRETYVDRSFFEKVTEMDFADRKRVDTSFMEHTTETTVSR